MKAVLFEFVLVILPIQDSHGSRMFWNVCALPTPSVLSFNIYLQCPKPQTQPPSLTSPFLTVGLLGLPSQSTTGRGLKQQEFISSRSWRPDVQDQGASRLVSLEASLLGVWTAIASLCHRTVVPLCVSHLFLSGCRSVRLGTVRSTSFYFN